MTTTSLITNCLLLLLSTTTAFQLHHRTTPSAQTLSRHPLPPLHLSQNQEETEEDLIGSPTYQSSIDWDAEWKKVVNDIDQPKDRPKDPTLLEMKANVAKSQVKRVKGTVARNMFDVSEEMKRKVGGVGMPSWTMLQGDWRFWIGIIAVISFGLSILSVSGTSQANESFYI